MTYALMFIKISIVLSFIVGNISMNISNWGDNNSGYLRIILDVSVDIITTSYLVYFLWFEKR